MRSWVLFERFFYWQGAFRLPRSNVSSNLATGSQVGDTDCQRLKMLTITL